MVLRVTIAFPLLGYQLRRRSQGMVMDRVAIGAFGSVETDATIGGVLRVEFSFRNFQDTNMIPGSAWKGSRKLGDQVSYPGRFSPFFAYDPGTWMHYG